MKLDKKSKKVVESNDVVDEVNYVELFDMLAEEASQLSTRIDEALKAHDEMKKLKNFQTIN